MMWAGFDALWVVYLGVAVNSVFAALQNPAYKASVTDLLDPDSYARASGLMQLAESSRFLISPILAGFLLAHFSIVTVLMIDTATFLLAVLAVLGIRSRVDRPESGKNTRAFRSDLIDGFRYVFSCKGLLWLLCITSLVTFSIGYLQSLFGPMMLALTDAKTLGGVQTIMATGMLASSILIGVFSRTGAQVLILSVSLAFAGLWYALLGVSTRIPLIVASGCLFFINTSLDVLIRMNVRNEIQGRVWSIVSLISQSGMIVAFGTAGVLADHVFNPLFNTGGLMASSIGRIVGTGEGRGIAFMFVLSGLFTVAVAATIGRIETIKNLETRAE
jgi:MFS family permease